MAGKSITVTADAEPAIALIAEYAAARSGSVERLPLQNGARLKLALPSCALGVNVYPSKGGGCKIVFDRPDTPTASAIARALSGAPSPAKKPKSAGASIDPVIDDAPSWIGSDESGKGDYFGPLVVAAVALTREDWRTLEVLGVQDSKQLTDARAAALAGPIRDAFPHEVVTIMPPRYNELWTKFRTVNRLLAWGHARAIENVARRSPGATAAVADQFGDESLIRDALFKTGRALQLVQMPRAERDPAVAAASVLARAEFLRRLDQLGRAAGIRLPKGAGPPVDAAARTLVAARGVDTLRAYAKVHFRTTQKVLGA